MLALTSEGQKVFSAHASGSAWPLLPRTQQHRLLSARSRLTWSSLGTSLRQIGPPQILVLAQTESRSDVAAEDNKAGRFARVAFLRLRFAAAHVSVKYSIAEVYVHLPPATAE